MPTRTNLSAMLLAAVGSASCGGDPGPLVTARIVDARATLVRDSAGDHGAGTFVV